MAKHIYDAAMYDGYINQKILQLHLSKGVTACAYRRALSPSLSLSLTPSLSFLPHAAFTFARKRIKCAFAALNCRHSKLLHPPPHSPLPLHCFPFLHPPLLLPLARSFAPPAVASLASISHPITVSREGVNGKVEGHRG